MILFFLLALLSIISAAVVVLHRNPVYCALSLVNTLFLLAVMFVMLDAHMIAALQVMVYAGAIVVLFLFVIMLLSLTEEVSPAGSPGLQGAGALGAIALGVELAALAAAAAASGGLKASAQQAAAAVATSTRNSTDVGFFGSPEAIGEILFTRHLLAFELTSVLLLVAIVGAVVMARRKI